jgi:hypothetical protein
MSLEAEIGSAKDELKQEVANEEATLRKVKTDLITELQTPKKEHKVEKQVIDSRSAMEKAYESA